MSPDPKIEWVNDLTNDFPYPTSVVKAWQDAIANHAQDLAGNEELKKTLIDCAPKLTHAIASLEEGFRIKNSPDSTAEKLADAEQLYIHAQTEIPGCKAANDLALQNLNTNAQQGGTNENVKKQPDPQQGHADIPDYGTVLPAMTGDAPVNGETFRVNIPAGAIVGNAYAGPVNGNLGSTVFSRAQGTVKSKTEFEVTAIWDKSKRLVNIEYPITVTMNPR